MSRVINNVMLAGHCTVGEYATIAGGSGIHQFTRVGHHAYVGGLAAVEGDVIPFGMVLGNRAYLSGLNVIGMKRAGFNREAIRNVRRAYRMLFSFDLTFKENIDEVQSEFPERSARPGPPRLHPLGRRPRALLSAPSRLRPEMPALTPDSPANRSAWWPAAVACRDRGRGGEGQGLAPLVLRVGTAGGRLDGFEAAPIPGAARAMRSLP